MVKYNIFFQKCEEKEHDILYLSPMIESVSYEAESAYEALKMFSEDKGMENIIEENKIKFDKNTAESLTLLHFYR